MFQSFIVPNCYCCLFIFFSSDYGNGGTDSSNSPAAGSVRQPDIVEKNGNGNSGDFRGRNRVVNKFVHNVLWQTIISSGFQNHLEL